MPTITYNTEAEWLELRRNYGGSSESPALFGLGYEDMPSLWSLWALKSGKLPREELADDNERAWFGKMMEPVIAAAVTRKTGWQIEERREYVTHPEPIVKMGCTVDRYVVEHEDGPGIIEMKNRDWLQWADSYTDDRASLRDEIQLAHQFACLPDIGWGVVAVLVSGNDLKLYRYKRDDLTQQMADIQAGWHDLWERVAQGREPLPTHKEFPAWCQAHPTWTPADFEPPFVVTADGFDELVRQYLDADALAKEKDKVAKDAKAKILAHMEDHGHARSNMWHLRVKASHIKERTQTVKAHTRLSLKVEPYIGAKADPDAAAAQAWADAQKPLEQE